MIKIELKVYLGQCFIASAIGGLSKAIACKLIQSLRDSFALGLDLKCPCLRLDFGIFGASAPIPTRVGFRGTSAPC